MSTGRRSSYTLSMSFVFTVRFVLMLIVISMLSQDVFSQTAVFTQGSPGSNNMVLKVPITVYPGRDQSLPITFHYSSKVWRLGFVKSIHIQAGLKQSVAEAVYSEFSTAGWTTSLDIPKIEWPRQNDVYWYDGKPYAHGTQYPYTYRVARAFVHMPDGSTHELRKSDPAYQDTGSIDMVGTFYAVDGSRLRYDSTGANTGTLFLPDGTRYIINATTTQCIDRNGNTLNYNHSSRQWTDTMGRIIGMPWPSNPAATDYSYVVPGFNTGTTTYTLKFRNLSDVLSPGSPALKPIADYYLPDPSQEVGSYNSSNFPQPTQLDSMFASGYSEFEELPQYFTRVIGRGQVGTNVFNPVVLAEVVYPNGQSYKFFYNRFGELDKAIYPTGGYERYQYGSVPAFETQLTPYPQGNRGVSSKWLSANGTGNDEIQWQYTSQWEAGTSNYLMTVTGPDGLRHEARLYRTTGTTKFGYATTGNTGLPHDERTYSASGVLLRRKLTEWAFTSSTNNMPPQTTGTYVAFRNPRAVRSTSIFLDTGLPDALATSTSFAYDVTHAATVGSERTLASEYAFTTVPQTTAQSQPITSIPTGSLLRSTETSYLTSNANYRARNILAFPTASIVRDSSSNIIAQNTMAYDEAAYPLISYGSITGWTDPLTTYRGNATSSNRWLNFPASTWLETHMQYDQCGNVKTVWDEHDNQSEIDYSATYLYAYPTTSTSAPPDPSGTYGQSTGLVTTTVYDFNTGLVMSGTDANGRITSYEYNDSMYRPTKLTRPDGGWTTTTYSDVPGNTHVRKQTLQKTTPSQQATDSYEYFDKLGRTIRSFAYEGSTYLTEDTQYDSLGRVWRTSVPYRTSSLSAPVNPGNQWVTNTYDAMHRLQTVTTSDGAHTDSGYGYSLTGVVGTTITTSDQLGRSRKLISDAQGRILQAIEDSAVGGLNYQTNYTYDLLNNLRKVEQGAQLRYFGYDSLSRLIRIRHLEQVINSNLAWTDPVTGNSAWTAALTYDPVGNVTRRTDARNVITDLQYDQLNRVTTVRYSNDPQNTPGRDHYYDGYRQNDDNEIADSKGQLWQTETLNQVRFTTSVFDVLGRPKAQKQEFWTGSAWSSPYESSVTYNLAGSIVTETYPSGRSVTFDYDQIGRVKTFSGNLGGGSSRTYADMFEYSELGGLRQERFGTQTPLYHKQRHNARGQLWDMRLSTVSYSSNPADGNRGSIVNYYSNSFTQGGSGTDNNGNLLRQEISVPSSNLFQQNYTYDSLNRLKSVSEKLNGTGSDTFKQVFDYDRWGNRTVNFSQSSTNVPRPTYTADVNTNRLVAPSGFSYGYDNAGNQTNDNYTGNGQRTYDAENHLLSAQGTAGAWQYYKYSGDGLRVRRIVNGQETWQVYGLTGVLVAEYPANGASTSPQKEYGYRNGQLLVTAEPNTGGGGGGGGSVQNVTWTNPVGVSISGNNLTRTLAGDGWNAGAVSTQSIASGDGHAEFTATETNKRRTVGLTDGTTVTGMQHLDYGIYLSEDGQIAIHEGLSVYGAFGTYVSGDKLRVAIEGGVVKYRKNGTLLRTSTVAPTYPLYAGAALFSNAGTVTNAVLTSGGGGSSALIRWIVADHLGTPRMIVDESGSLAGVTRHDYLPFGEELGSVQVGLIGGRDTTPGYVSSTIRQRFTGYEYDQETGLNFAQARYQSPVQGRFTGVDPLGASASTANPQTFNRYTYADNSPTGLTDPTGMMPYSGADASFADVSDGLWGRSFDLNRRIMRGSAILFAAGYVHQRSIEKHFSDLRAADIAYRNLTKATQLAWIARAMYRAMEPEILWLRAELMSENEVLRVADFVGVANQAQLNVQHSRVGDVDRGAAFKIRVLFKLPKYARETSIDESSFVKLVKNNRWKFYETQGATRLVEWGAEDRSGWVIFHLQQVDAEGQNNRLIISVTGFYGNQEKFSGQATLRLVTNNDVPQQPKLKLP